MRIVGGKDMTIYIVRNEASEEVAAYTDQQQAELVAEELEEATLQHYVIEDVCDDAQNPSAEENSAINESANPS